MSHPFRSRTARRTTVPVGLVAVLILSACAGPAAAPLGGALAGPAPSVIAPTASYTPTRARATGTQSPAQGPADPDGSPVAAALARANLGKTAGTCAATPMRNSLGGAAFEHSCVGWNKVPEYWCADFAIWVWRNTGYDVAGLDAASYSFVTYGRRHASTRERARVGDALVFGTSPTATTASHVAVVLAVNGDGSVVVANGDWGGQPGGEVRFATTASVAETTIPAAAATVGAGPVEIEGGRHLMAIVAPVRPA